MSAVSDLAAKLYDPTYQQWTANELATYVVEALRTWNALTSFWRGEFAFSLAAGTWWYDLTTQTGSLRPMTATDSDLVQTIEYHLLEPLTSTYPLAWTGSSQFALSDILAAIQGKRDEVLSASGCTLVRSTVNAPFVNRVFLSDSIVDIRRVAWLPTPGFGYDPAPLVPGDNVEQNSFDSDWTTAAPGQPSSFLRSAQPPLSFDVDRVPPVAGDYELLTVNAGADLSTAAATLLGIPDDWAWVVKWGALADLFERDGLARDDLRAQYCGQRYQEGLELLGQAGAVLDLRINNIPVLPGAVRDGDDYDSDWQARPAGSPGVAYVAGLNLVGLPLSSGVWSVTATVVRNAPIPTLPSDLIQVGKDDLNVILDYAQHLAMLKRGGAEFVATIPLYQGFLTRAALYNRKLAALGSLQRRMYEMSKDEVRRNPVLEASNA